MKSWLIYITGSSFLRNSPFFLGFHGYFTDGTRFADFALFRLLELGCHVGWHQASDELANAFERHYLSVSFSHHLHRRHCHHQSLMLCIIVVKTTLLFTSHFLRLTSSVILTVHGALYQFTDDWDSVRNAVTVYTIEAIPTRFISAQLSLTKI